MANESFHWVNSRLSGQSVFPGGHQADEVIARRIAVQVPRDLPFRRVFVSWFNWANLGGSYVNKYDILAFSGSISYGFVRFARNGASLGEYRLDNITRIFPSRLVQVNGWDWCQYAMGPNEIGIPLATTTDLAAILSPRMMVVDADEISLEVIWDRAQDATWNFDLYLGCESFAAAPGA